MLKNSGIGKIGKKAEQLEHKAAEESKTPIEEAIYTLNKSNITAGKFHVICIGGPCEKSKSKETQQEDDFPAKKEIEKAKNVQDRNYRLKATLFQVKEK